MVKRTNNGLPRALLVAILATSCGLSFAEDLSSAYAAQRQVVLAGLGDASPVGFKLGLNSAELQQRFGATSPVVGVLPLRSRQPLATPLQLRDFKKPMLEVELAFRLRETVTQPIANIDELKSLVAAMGAAVELPDLGLMTSRSPRVDDVIQANVGASRFLVSPNQAVFGIDPANVNISLLRDGEPVVAGKADDLNGGQWQALLFLINQSIANGWQVTPQHWLLTGAIGGMQPLQVGRYQAYFGFTHFDFTVVD